MINTLLFILSFEICMNHLTIHPNTTTRYFIHLVFYSDFTQLFSVIIIFIEIQCPKCDADEQQIPAVQKISIGLSKHSCVLITIGTNLSNGCNSFG